MAASEGRFNLLQAGGALIEICVDHPKIGRVFAAYARGGRMSCSQWLTFTRSEQLSNTHVAEEPAEAQNTAVSSSPHQQLGSSLLAGLSLPNQRDGRKQGESDSNDSVELLEAKISFERQFDSNATDGQMSLPKFASLLLAPQNDAVVSAVSMDLTRPVAQ